MKMYKGNSIRYVGDDVANFCESYQHLDTVVGMVLAPFVNMRR